MIHHLFLRLVIRVPQNEYIESATPVALFTVAEATFET